MFVFSIRANGSTVIENGYDDMGRRYMKKVTLNGVITLHHHYLYRGYLQIVLLSFHSGGLTTSGVFVGAIQRQSPSKAGRGGNTSIPASAVLSFMAYIIDALSTTKNNTFERFFT